MAVGAIPAAANAAAKLGPVAMRAWNLAMSKYPQVAANAGAYLQKSSSQGASVERMASSQSPQTQAVVVKALLDNGLPAVDFVRLAQLTPAESRQYSQLIAAAVQRQDEVVDSRQAPSVSSGDAELDRAVRNMEIHDACKILGISSESYAKLITWFNTHTHADVEKFQLHRKVNRQGYI